jgi:transposase InsO family protein
VGKYDELAKRKIIRKSYPCRVNITVFAANPVANNHSQEGSGAQMPAARPVETERMPEDYLEPVQPEIPEVTNHQDSQKTYEVESRNPMEQEDNASKNNRFLALPREEQAMLRRAHQNLCHPSPEQLSMVLRNQGVRPEVSQAVFDMKCATCASQQKPKIARPSTLKHELDFNDKVFIDGVTWKSKTGKMFHFYHILDQATNFHVAVPAPSRAAEQAVQCVSESWFQWAGPPNMMVTDSGTEFTSDHFLGFLQRFDVKPITSAPHAHWQNGRSERHGQILQSMLNKIDQEMPIQTYQELQLALVQCTHAKNTLSIRKGFSPEVLVFGKSSRIPGSVTSCEMVSSLASADREDAQGISFRKSLALREKARVAYHQTDNDMALRRACLRRSRPDRSAYHPGEWVMLWQPEQNGGHWFGPLKVVNQEDRNSVWATHGGKLYRRALEHVRPVCSTEVSQIPTADQPSIPNQPNQVTSTETIPSDNPNPITNPNHVNNPETQSNQDDHSQSQDQPDLEPEASQTPPESQNEEENDPAVETPIPESTEDDELITTHLLCCEDVIMHVDPAEVPCAWRCELEVPQWIDPEKSRMFSPDELLMATTEKKQRTEVKLSVLSSEEQKAFAAAKDAEVQNWIKTGTVSRILRAKLAPEQILRCRWILTWKPLDGKTPDAQSTESKLKSHKPKARLVVLGYMDPQLTEVPRDSPTLGKQSKMLLLQLIASMGWTLGSFDIKAAFLQGKPQKDRVIGLDPVVELARAMNLKSHEICKLDKSAYGLIDAPYLWFQTLQEELKSLGFKPSPFDPCVFVLRHPNSNDLSGVLGIHVDDGIYGGDQFFQNQISKLEEKYPFGSKKSQSFTFTGIDLHQNPDNSIELSQSQYIRNINPIVMKSDRRAQEDEPVTEEERHLLRGLIGSLQYAAVHTRPDLTSSLSHLQSQINKATVTTLIMANKTLHTAKKHSDVIIRINPIAIRDLRFLAFSDASFASKAKPESYAGMIIMATHKDISKNKSCAISPLSWGTKKIQRVVTSTLSAETSALSTTLDQLTWIRIYWAWLLNPNVPWQRPETAEDIPEAVTVPTIKVDEKDLAITDCKSLFDLTTRTAVPSCQEYRTQLLARSIKDMLAENIRLHWVHSGAQLADALTKIMEGQFLRETLRQGRYCLHDENEILKSRANARNRLKWLKTTAEEMSSHQ